MTPRPRTVTSGLNTALTMSLAEAAVFLAVGISEEVEAAHFVGTIRLAEARADAAVVDLHVKPFAVVDRSRHRADRLARRVLAVHAGHGREAGSAVDDIFVDPQPMHVAAFGDFVRADDRNIVFSLAGDDAGVAADAGRVVDHHRPFVGVVICAVDKASADWRRVC